MTEWDEYELKENRKQQEKVLKVRSTLVKVIKDFPSAYINGSEVKLLEITDKNIVQLVKLEALGVINLTYTNKTKDFQFSNTSLIELEVLVNSGDIEKIIHIDNVHINKWFSKLPTEIPVKRGDYILIDPNYDDSLTRLDEFDFSDSVPLITKLECLQADRYFKTFDQSEEFGQNNQNEQNGIKPFSWLD